MAQRSANLDHRVADLMRPNPDHPLDPGAVEAVLHGLRAQLDLDVVFVAEFAEGRRVFRFVDRHPDAPPVQDGTWHDLEASFCLRVVDGRLPEYIPDVGALGPEVDLPPVPFPIGTHLGTPVVLHDGSTYGTLCCFSLAAKPLMSDADLRLLRHCARLVARKIDAARALGLDDPTPTQIGASGAPYESKVWLLRGAWQLGAETRRAWPDS